MSQSHFPPPDNSHQTPASPFTRASTRLLNTHAASALVIVTSSRRQKAHGNTSIVSPRAIEGVIPLKL